MLKIILYACLFLIVGEILVRIDEQVAPFSNDDQVRIAIKMEESRESKMVADRTVPMDDSTYRIMVLGDSYIHGAAISDSDKFATLVRDRLLADPQVKQYKRCLVLDVSRPANNNLDNYNIYKTFNPAFKPQLVILAYNHNDVLNDLDESVQADSKPGAAMPAKQKDKPSFIKSVYNVLYLSHIVQFTLHSFNSYLKSFGYVVPHSVFDETLRAYTENKPNWIKSKVILTKFEKETESRKQHLLVILMPEFDLIGSQKLFLKADGVIRQYFTDSGAAFLNPVAFYASYDPEELRLSKYDGHPNAYAHHILADSIMTFIRQDYLHN